MCTNFCPPLCIVKKLHSTSIQYVKPCVLCGIIYNLYTSDVFGFVKFSVARNVYMWQCAVVYVHVYEMW